MEGRHRRLKTSSCCVSCLGLVRSWIIAVGAWVPGWQDERRSRLEELFQGCVAGTTKLRAYVRCQEALVLAVTSQGEIGRKGLRVVRSEVEC